MNLTEELSRLCEQDADVALIIETYSAIDSVYKKACSAMGLDVSQTVGDARNSSEVTLFVEHQSSAVDVVFTDENNR